MELIMVITNNAGYPEALVKAVSNDNYSRGEGVDRSVTGLLSPPRQAALKEIYGDQITEDVSDRTYALYGQLVHLLLERAGEQSRNAINEERLYDEVNGWKISGQTDTLTLTEDQRTWIISDYKFVTSYKFKREYSGELVIPEEYEQQLNMYAYLLRENGFKVDSLKIVAIYRDWSKLEAKRDKNYPQLGAETHDVPLWTEERAIAFIEERVQLHQDAMAGDMLGGFSEEELPECTDDERWAKKDSWALKTTRDSKRARKVFYGSKARAVAWALDPNNKVKSGFVVEHRPGANVRCENYCVVSEFCEQFKSLQAFQKAV
tara:strand:- start:356 stop:1312 length:957 start_codon:yes stop_codon:yes gene_type:complete